MKLGSEVGCNPPNLLHPFPNSRPGLGVGPGLDPPSPDWTPLPDVEAVGRGWKIMKKHEKKYSYGEINLVTPGDVRRLSSHDIDHYRILSLSYTILSYRCSVLFFTYFRTCQDPLSLRPHRVKPPSPGWTPPICVHSPPKLGWPSRNWSTPVASSQPQSFMPVMPVMPI